ncbi:hypothetical protein [[Eubacterium] hominis]|uniref:hypothetical protein n=1 Tax=[Eubacterium] hominis TaxID=2764325 RepID=UPI003A4E0C4E
MKDVSLFLEQNCKKSVKQLIIIYGIAIILFGFSFLLNEVNQGIHAIFLIISLAIIAKVNHDRLKDMVANGALTRLRLLPVKRAAFCVSEILFCTISYMGIFVCLYLAWFAYTAFYLPQMQGNMFLFTTWSYTVLDFLFSLDVLHIMILLLYLLTLGINTVGGSLCSAMKRKDISVYSSICFSYWIIFNVTNVTLVWSLIVCGLMLLVMAYSLFYINRYLRLIRK